jgi:hypothetical protein
LKATLILLDWGVAEPSPQSQRRWLKPLLSPSHPQMAGLETTPFGSLGVASQRGGHHFFLNKLIKYNFLIFFNYKKIVYFIKDTSYGKK